MPKKHVKDLEGLLRAHGVSKADLAVLSGVSLATIYKLVAGRTDVYTDTLAAIAKGMGVPIGRVLVAFRVTRNNARALV